jgi:hypothetical protein
MYVYLAPLKAILQASVSRQIAVRNVNDCRVVDKHFSGLRSSAQRSEYICDLYMSGIKVLDYLDTLTYMYVRTTVF